MCHIDYFTPLLSPGAALTWGRSRIVCGEVDGKAVMVERLVDENKSSRYNDCDRTLECCSIFV